MKSVGKNSLQWEGRANRRGDEEGGGLHRWGVQVTWGQESRDWAGLPRVIRTHMVGRMVPSNTPRQQRPAGA